MAQDPHSPSQRKTVGVYDRPASADRPKSRPVLLVVIAAIVIGVVLWVMLRH